MVREGRRARTAGRHEEAIQLFARSLDLDPRHAGARRELSSVKSGLGETLAREGDGFMERREWEQALSAFRKAYKHHPQLTGLEQRIQRAEREARAEMLVAEGNNAFERGAWRAAYKRFDEAWSLTSHREHFRTRRATARDRFAEEFYDQAHNVSSVASVGAYKSIREFHPGYRDVEERSTRLSVRLHAARQAYEAGRRFEEVRHLLRAQEQYLACARAISRFRDLEERQRTVGDAIALAEDFYSRAARAESRGELERARVLFEECLSIVTPFRDVSDRIARVGQFIAAQESAVRIYQNACRAQAARDLESAHRLFVSCQRTRPGYRDVVARQSHVEAALATAREIRRRGVEAEERCKLGRARILYEECLAVCSPCSDVEARLTRVRRAMETLEEARRLERERRLLAARKLYRELLERYDALAEARERAREIDRVCDDLTVRYDAALEAQQGKKFRSALSLARGVQEQCVGCKDVDTRITTLESELDYAEACAFEEKNQYEMAMRSFERCAKRTPGFRDVEERLRNWGKRKNAHDRGVHDHGRGEGRRGGADRDDI